ncbi:unnamed protein product [Vitrella brassicaformis CCMP3155]|uniref:Uncharacterized protein n=2 Tax=Vitrella brassicaformis TaxID=1169539 RepID=A0A0G4FGS7_VITBC|nr:unnamed protein product [Vitrella brassicaformis CCMP3155]|mmetsp:Transcript_32836/g.81335  ORF Transcript_32836/g.81335 Transcript_32836/m.81335 type:complete len:444 (+) Transcript_32836:27-1358(+)|eukprot:CEM12653.1 unnamed protein product [Vitrella brassicaformis CCMP3155]
MLPRQLARQIGVTASSHPSAVLVRRLPAQDALNAARAVGCSWGARLLHSPSSGGSPSPPPSISSSSSSVGSGMSVPHETRKLIGIVASGRNPQRQNVFRELFREANGWIVEATRNKVTGDTFGLYTRGGLKVSVSATNTAATQQPQTLNLEVRGAGLPWSSMKDRLTNLTTKCVNATALTEQLTLGLHSAFAIADKIEIVSRPAGCTDPDFPHGWKLTADKSGQYTVEPHVEGGGEGMQLTCHLKQTAACEALAAPDALRNLSKRYAHYLNGNIPLTVSIDGVEYPVQALSAAQVLFGSGSGDNGHQGDLIERAAARTEQLLTTLQHQGSRFPAISPMAGGGGGGGIPLIPNHDIQKFASFIINWALAYRWIFIYFFRFTFQSSRVALSMFIFSQILKVLLATTLAPMYLTLLGFLIGFELAYGLLQIYIACIFIGYFMTAIL